MIKLSPFIYVGVLIGLTIIIFQPNKNYASAAAYHAISSGEWGEK
jgi:hypothetical protein